MTPVKYMQDLEFGSNWPLPLTHSKVTVSDLYSRYEANQEASPVCADMHHRLAVEYAKLEHPTRGRRR